MLLTLVSPALLCRLEFPLPQAGYVFIVLQHSFESISVDNSTTTNALVELKEKFPLQINMDSQEIRDRYYGGEGAARDAFEELCALYDAIQVLKPNYFNQFLFSNQE